MDRFKEHDYAQDLMVTVNLQEQSMRGSQPAVMIWQRTNGPVQENLTVFINTLLRAITTS